MKLGIFGSPVLDDNAAILYHLIDLCRQRNIDVYAHSGIASHVSERYSDIPFVDGSEFPSANTDFVFSLGGDGTILNAVAHIGKKEVPVIGINLGRLGFLASIETKFVEEVLDSLINGRYKIDSRTLLFLESSVELFEGRTFALNDFTLHKQDTVSMITVRVYINGEFLNTYWSDGIIVATPTGSTGYSLSCGGPIIFPQSENFVITPVAPHNLNIRPIVISDNSVISFEMSGRSNSFLCSLDSRTEMVDENVELAVRKCPFKAHLVTLHEYSYMKNMRHKLNWGMDKRN